MKQLNQIETDNNNSNEIRESHIEQSKTHVLLSRKTA